MEKLKVSILYCEDELIVMKSISKLIERKVETVYTAMDGVEGMSKFKEYNPQIVITDIRMPNLSGLDMIQQMREINPDCRFIIVSAYGQTDYFQRAIDIGVHGFLLKPLNKDKLYRMIEDLSDTVILREQIRDEKIVRRQAEEELIQVNRMLRIINECNERLIRAREKEDLLNDICDIIVDIGGYPFAWIGEVFTDENQIIKPVAQSGFEDDFLHDFTIQLEVKESTLCPISKAVKKRETQIYNIEEAIIPGIPCNEMEVNTIKFSSMISLPIMIDGNVFGALTIYSSEVDAFDDNEQKVLKELSDDLAYGLKAIRLEEKEKESLKELKRSYEQLSKLLSDIVNTLTSLVEIRDPYTAGHQRRVSSLAVEIARKLELPDDKLEGIRIASLVHDIGKMYVPAEILSKPGKLTEHEFNIIKSHPQAGYDILKNVEFPWPVSQIVIQHHEREDGSGYPNGLESNEILTEAKIIAVSDVVEAMSSHRPYRPALGIEIALQEIRENKGKKYAPDVVDACIEVFESDKFAFT